LCVRHFVEASFLGTNYVGWQRQPNGISVQEVIENSISTVLRKQIQIVGCGRTDAGVHAQQYFFHFDTDKSLPKGFVFKLNRFMPNDIAFYDVRLVKDDMHARFSAKSRSYTYYLSLRKEPLRQNVSVEYRYPGELDFDLMNEAAAILQQYRDFKTFCKQGSDTPHFLCDLTEASWSHDQYSGTFKISANRFLRGMVRLIVGMTLRIGRHQLTLDELRKALDDQVQLKKSESAPAHGLHLTLIQY
jgi:tRNA pseudouridine38-40 synthase